MNPIFYAKVQESRIVLKDPPSFNKFLASLEGKDVQLVLKKETKTRSLQENKYYWGVVVKLLSDHTGYSSNEMHDALRMLFLCDKGREIPIIRSTTSLTTVEMELYLTQIREFASQTLSVYIPEPNEVSI